MSWKKTTRVAVIGAGFVGSSFAYAALNQGVADELVLIDLNQQKAEGEAMDLNHGVPFTRPMTIWAGTYADTEQADIVIITAGANQGPGETRLDLVEKNVAIFESIVQDVMNVGFDGIILVATNPVDVLSFATWRMSGLEPGRVIGSGTILDTARLRYLLSDYFQVDARNVHASIVGEHGDTALPVWSHAAIGGRFISDYVKDENHYANWEDLEQLFVQAREAAYDIIERKQATYYGIAMGLVRLTQAILQDENAVLTVSVLLQQEYGEDNVYIGVPAIVNGDGVREVVELPLSSQEETKFKHSVNVMKNITQAL
ncbi:L-lactate dehydrogenase [Salsuginibacillus kocurii]|uniref:L-lactate dehydrogenase n=1 Tax=Salsuginibacillus kocurii TaxID=427078 RepID=UPI000364D344|nr:L-lactate dehydrogenase [Salsuginibacillus kocurii]